MKKSTKISGKVWVVADKSGSLIDDIDTDMIFHNAHLAITDISQMGRHAFGNLEGWEDFSEKAAEGDIIIVGKNFGSGSSRQQAVDCFTSLGVKLIIGESFGAIYKRNAVNSGFPVVEASGINVKSGDNITVDLEAGSIETSDGSKFEAKPFSGVQMDIFQAGSLFAYGKLLK